MIERRTVFVLGAGASKPYGFPTGPELRHDLVTRILATSSQHKEAVNSGRTQKPRLYDYHGILSTFTSPRVVEQCQKALGRSWATSVDMFMSTQPESIRAVCKAGIVLAIAEAESQEDQLFFAPPAHDWFRYLWRYLHKGCREATDVCLLNKVSFITFNYDRTLEWSLANGIMHTFHVDEQEAIASLPRIAHFYGDLGTLSSRPYGAPPNFDGLQEAVERIQVIEESEEFTPNMEQARSFLRDASQVIFLGFGYDETNMRLLGVGRQQGVLPDDARCFGTLYGLQLAEAKTVLNLFSLGKNAQGEFARFAGEKALDADALTYLRQYHHLLT